jgi:hypothetical protein
MNRVLVLVISLLACALAAMAAPELAQVSSPTGPVVMQSIWDLHHHPKGGAIQPQLRHGVEADTDDWPASFYFTFQGSQGPELCSASLVGPQALLTAAHCVPPTKILPFRLTKAPFTATCTEHAIYNVDVSADWALCKVGAAVPVPGGLFETIELTPLSAMQGSQLVLGGFGCTSDQVSQAQVAASPTYVIGSNVVAETSLTASSRSYDSQFYGESQKNNLFTEPWGANTCPGDSGGPAFRITLVSGKLYAHRVIDAVNSRVFYADSTHTTWGASLLSGTGGPDFVNWATTWANQQKVTICGINAGPVASCRQ